MSDAILWLEKDGKRWGLVEFATYDGVTLSWVGAGMLWFSGDVFAYLPGGANINDGRAAITRDEAIALVRRYAPAFGYTVRERVVAGVWCNDTRVYDGTVLCAARVECDGWCCWLAQGRPTARGPETGPAGMAAADRWLTENAPWVTLEGGAYTVPEVVPEPAPAAPAAVDRFDVLAARVARLEARAAVVDAPARDPRTHPRPGDVLWSAADGGTVYLVKMAENGLARWSWLDVRGRMENMCDGSIEYWRTVFSGDASTVLRVAP